MVRFSGGGAGAGALSGASIGGSIGGPIGAGIGGLAGSLFGGFGGGNKQAKLKKLSTLNKNQSSLLDLITDEAKGMQGARGQATNYYQDLLDPSGQGYQKFAQPNINQFNQETIPGLAERFAGGAQGGALSSSGFGQALSSAGAGLQDKLAQLKTALMDRAAQGIYGQSNQLANQSLGTQAFGYGMKPAQQGGLSGFLSNYSQGMSRGDYQDLGNNISEGFGNLNQYLPLIGNV